MIREIMSKMDVFPKPSDDPLKLLSKGIASFEAEKWAKHRKLISPAFHIDRLKHMVPSFYLSCGDMLRKWDEMVGNEGSCEVDVWPSLQTMTSDVISRTAFGSSHEEGRKIFELQREQMTLIVEAAGSLFIPGWRYVHLLRTGE
ncbi:hypothetical protein SASPL_124290 [Salvia splendens]|uniref:Uncharacterized protein n=1 Tax=Salvia splendens TaxID=180675 RepID=A0A8X8ZUU2_SALSN|nr:hypothetical protein SASPL_124290 [Salvia splendens]